MDMDIDPSKKSNLSFIKFSIHYNQEVHSINLLASSTIENLKNILNRQTHVPVCRQLIQGWAPENVRQANMAETVLGDLNLGPENELILIDLSHEGFVDITEK